MVHISETNYLHPWIPFLIFRKHTIPPLGYTDLSGSVDIGLQYMLIQKFFTSDSINSNFCVSMETTIFLNTTRLIGIDV